MEAEMKILVVLFARHGQTEHNKTRTLAGQQPGKLTKKGQEQAQMIGSFFKKQNKTFDFIYVSDLGRTKQTFSQLLKKAPQLANIPKQYTGLIRQKSAGILQNKPLSAWSENAKKQHKSIRQYKCKHGESWVDVMKRAQIFLQKMIETHLIKKSQTQKSQILAISHGGFIMQFHNVCESLNSEQIHFDNSALNCSMHQFQIWYPSNEETYKKQKVKIQCTKKNFVGHLQ